MVLEVGGSIPLTHPTLLAIKNGVFAALRAACADHEARTVLRAAARAAPEHRANDRGGQMLGALVSKYSMKRNAADPSEFDVELREAMLPSIYSVRIVESEGSQMAPIHFGKGGLRGLGRVYRNLRPGSRPRQRARHDGHPQTSVSESSRKS